MNIVVFWFLFWLKFHWNLFPTVNRKYAIPGSDNGLVPNRQQAIIWTNDGIVWWWAYAWLSLNDLMELSYSIYRDILQLGNKNVPIILVLHTLNNAENKGVSKPVMFLSPSLIHSSPPSAAFMCHWVRNLFRNQESFISSKQHRHNIDNNIGISTWMFKYQLTSYSISRQ